VNAYLQDITGRDISAKDFRTWAGTMLAAEELRKTGPAKTKREADRNIIAAVDLTAKRLGNTRSVCRKYYIHPALIEAYLEGSVLPPLPERQWSARKPRGPALRQHELDVLTFLKARLKPEKRRAVASRYRKSSAEKPAPAISIETGSATAMVPASGDQSETDPTDS
jgi:DNA topoisomerase-1